MSATEIHGHCEPSLHELKQAFTRNFAAGEEVGASLALMQDGELRLDLWAGYADRHGSKPWQQDTIVNVFSTGKAVTAMLVLMLVDRGLLDLDTPIATYWPEFAANGKAHVTVRDAFTHRAGVPAFATPRPWDTPHDWASMVALIAAERPWFEPGTLCYHAITFGFIMGELIRRVTGQNIQAYGARALFEPLGAEFCFLLEPEQFPRVASLTHDEQWPIEEGSILARVMGGLADPPAGTNLWEAPERKVALMPGSNNYSNARGLATLGSVIALNGTVNGHAYLSEALVGEACSEQAHANCPCMGDLRLGLAFGLDGPGFSAPSSTSVHWGGYGGSWIVMDPRARISVAYAMNYCHVHAPEDEDIAEISLEDPRQDRIWGALRDVLGSAA